MYNYSARRKEGLGSLRPGYYSGGPTDILIGNLLNWGGRKIYDHATKSKEQREEEAYKKTMKNLGIQPYFPEDYGRDDNNNNNNKNTTTYSGKGIGGGILNALATMILGPIMGPIAMTVGRGVMNKSKGLGFFGGGGDGPGAGPKGPKGPGPQIDYYTGSDEEDKDIENQITKNFSGIDSGGWDPGVASETANEGPSNGGSSGPTTTGQEGSPEHGGQSSSTAGAGMSRSDDSWSSSPFFKGGRVSYSQGGLASLWQR